MGKIILNNIEYGIGTPNSSNVDTTNLVEKDSIVTTLDDTVTDEQIPSAKAVHTAIQSVSAGVPADVYSKTEVDDLLADKADIDDLVDAYSKTEVDTLLDNKANVDDIVDAYTKEEVDNLLDSKVNTDDLVDGYSKEEVNNLLADKADSTDIIDAYTKEEVNNLLDGKVGTDDVIDAYSKTEVDNLLNAKVDTDDLVETYSKDEIDGLLADKADSTDIVDAYTKGEVDNLLDAKADATTLNNYVTNSSLTSTLSNYADIQGVDESFDNYVTYNNNTYALKTQIPTSLPASDVYAWAKEATKPTYTASEVGALASNGTAVNASKVNNALTLQIAGTTKNTFNGSSAQTFNIPNASTSTSGVMTKDMVTKLNGIATGATKNTIDTAMSSTSTNSVQNKVIYAYIQEQLKNLANGGISVIKSIQRGTSIIESGDYYREIRIDAVDVNKTMVNYLGFTGASNDSSADHKYRGYLKLVDSTTLTIRRADSDGSDYTFSWEVIEFN